MHFAAINRGEGKKSEAESYQSISLEPGTGVRRGSPPGIVKEHMPVLCITQFSLSLRLSVRCEISRSIVYLRNDSRFIS